MSNEAAGFERDTSQRGSLNGRAATKEWIAMAPNTAPGPAGNQTTRPDEPSTSDEHEHRANEHEHRPDEHEHEHRANKHEHRDWDVIVVGAGNAAMSAALAARECGASVLVLERDPFSERGGNTAFTAGAMRVTYRGADDLRALMPDLTAEELARTDFGTYPAEQFREDLARLTEYRADPELVDVVVRDSQPTLRWLREKGVRFVPAYGRQAFRSGERMRFWGASRSKSPEVGGA